MNSECGKTDNYRREICRIIVNVADINQAQVKAGMSCWYRDSASEQSHTDREDYEIAELNANFCRLGLRADKNPVPPWEWRKS